MSPHRLLACLGPPLAIAICVGVVYAGSLQVPFLFDDNSAILANENVRQLWPLSVSAWAAPDLPVSGRPLVCFSLAVNYALGRYEAFGYHLFNVVIHACNALLVFGVLRRALNGRMTAAAAALIWALHPLGSEAVVYVTQRTELLVSLFILLTLYAAIRGFAAPRSRAWHGFAIVAGFAAVLCKEVAVALPPLVLLYDRAFVSGSLGIAWARHKFLHAGLLFTWLPLGWLLLATSRGNSVGFDLGVGWHEYLLTQAGVLSWYLRTCFVPTGLSLAHDWPIVENLLEAWPAALGMGALLLAGLVLSIRAPRFGFALVWFFLILAPSSSVLPIVSEVAAERRMYLPLLGVVALLVYGVRALAGRIPHRIGAGLATAAAVLVVVAMGTLTDKRIGNYESATSIWQDALTLNPRGKTALINLARARERNGRFDDARRLYRRAIDADPDNYIPHLNLGGLLARNNDLEDAETHLQRARRLAPEHPGPLVNLGNVASMQGKWQSAVLWYRAALRKDERRVAAHANLANALGNMQRFSEAQEHLEEAARLDPDNPKHRDALIDLRAKEAEGRAR